MKCKYCGKVDTEDNLVKMVRVKDGAPVLNKRTKQPLYDYYHLECKQRAQNVQELNNFISMLYGTDVPFPTRILRSLKPYWERYGYTTLLSYLRSVENYLVNAKCNDRTHRMNLLVYMVKNNIDEFAENNKKQETPTQQDNIGFITKVSKKTFNDDNYDLI